MQTGVPKGIIRRILRLTLRAATHPLAFPFTLL